VRLALNVRDEKTEQQVQKRTSDENIDFYSEMFSAKTLNEGQDGGVVTSMLVWGLQRGLFDCAVVVQRKEGYRVEAVAAKTVCDVLNAKGTTYLRVNTISKLKELVETGERRVALVGTPCQVQAARKMQSTLLKSYPDFELTLVGLFCFEAFNYERLKGEVWRLLSVDLDAAEKTQIRKGKFTVSVGGKESSVSVKELSAAVEKGCSRCSDFAARYADVSVGSVGSDEGYSTVVVRTPVGRKLVENLDLTRGEVRREEIVKLAAFKKKRASNV
jgi:coenzyme F420-reducing hydrogenase beta subunit